MSQVVFLLEDNLEVHDAVKKGIQNDANVKFARFKWPWQLLDELEKRSKDKEVTPTTKPGQPLPVAVVADLYSPGYWRLHPDKSSPFKKKYGATNANDPEIVKDAALDCIQNYLRPMIVKYDIPVVVYTHVPVYLATEKDGNPEWAASVMSILENTVGGKDNIVVKEVRDEQSRDEISKIVNRVKYFIESSKSPKKQQLDDDQSTGRKAHPSKA